jgi:hypothetical protein
MIQPDGPHSETNKELNQVVRYPQKSGNGNQGRNQAKY